MEYYKGPMARSFLVAFVISGLALGAWDYKLGTDLENLETNSISARIMLHLCESKADKDQAGEKTLNLDSAWAAYHQCDEARNRRYEAERKEGHWKKNNLKLLEYVSLALYIVPISVGVLYYAISWSMIGGNPFAGLVEFILRRKRKP